MVLWKRSQMPLVCGPDFGFAALNVIDCQIQLVIMGFRPAVILGAAIRQNAQHRQLFLAEERQDFVV